MSEYLLKNENFVPAKVAAKQVGYTTDYVTRLAREEKIPARKEGVKWVVDIDAVVAFAEEAEEDRMYRGRALRVERKTELLLRSAEKEASEVRTYIPTLPDVRIGRWRALTETVAILVVGFMVGSYVYYAPNYGESSSHVATIHETGVSFLEEAARSLYAVVTPPTHISNRSVPTDTLDNTPVQKHRSYNIVVSEGRSLSNEVLSDAFSDEVEINFDTEVFDRGIVTPRFENGNGDAYRFKILLEEINAVHSTE